jgi:hypothetical protein
LTGINEAIESKAKEVAILDMKIAEKQTLLDEAKMIAAMGFGIKQLAKLREMLSKMAAAQGVKPAEAATLFFEQVGNYQDLVTLELEVKGGQVAADKAKADAEFWQTEAKTAEAKSKARKAAVDFADKLIAYQIKQNDLPYWDRIIFKADVKPEKLATALEQYGSLEKLFQHRQGVEQKLEHQIKVLANQVKALMEEKQEVVDSMAVMRKVSLNEMEKMSKKALEIMDNLAIKSVGN